MNIKIWSLNLLLILSGGYPCGLLAAETPTALTTPTPTETPILPKTILLKDSDRVHDSENHNLPKFPGKGANGDTLKATNSDQIPRGEALNNLADFSFFSQIQDFNKAENKSKAYYWHPLKGVDYCHYRDGSANHWYGWQVGEQFVWALFKAGHFWWHDTYAERWLYFDRGYWWWQGSKKNQFQVYLEDGHYHVVDAEGTLGDDLFTTGTEEVVTEPVVKQTPLSKQQKEEGDPRSQSGQKGLDTFNH